ncbi:MAG: Sec-independent protein translocase subunit TatA/TatB [Solirubrobacterales bacterium]
MGFSVWQIAIVLVIALFIFGPKRLPMLARSAGNSARELKDSLGGVRDSILGDDEDESAKPKPIETARSV